MEEIINRFEIVRLSVKMADHECIKLQAEKLRAISLDEDLNEIISLLEGRKYRQALLMMKGYNEALDDSFFRSATTPVAQPKRRKKREEKSENYNLFDMTASSSSGKIDLDDMLRMTEESAKETVSRQDFALSPESYVEETRVGVQNNEAYLNIHKNRPENKMVKPIGADEEEVVSREEDPIKIPAEEMIEHAEQLLEKEHPSQKQRAEEEEGLEMIFPSTPQDEEMQSEVEELQAETDEVSEEVLSPEINDEVDTLDADALASNEEDQEEELPPLDMDDDTALTSKKYIEIDIEKIQMPIEDSLADKGVDTAVQLEEQESGVEARSDYDSDNKYYAPISYIDQKFRNMRHQFPQIEVYEGDAIEEVAQILKKMATKGYSERDIKEIIALFHACKKEGRLAEAAQFLLIAAASESKYAQLLLARELFKGEVLRVDYPEAFTQINRLAEHDYPDAVCDLAQLYEHGYGIKKDKKTALLLYEEAVEMGVQRAQKHVDSLSKKRGILGIFRKQ